MRVAIHQPHYFPWVGYFDKLAKVDQFILLDEVQFEKGSQMIRNRVLDAQGEIKYLTIMGETKGFLDKSYKDLQTKDNIVWKKRQINALESYYRQSPHQDEALGIFKGFLAQDYSTVCEWTCNSIRLICDLLGIETQITLQSELLYDREKRKSDLVLALCKAVKADAYYSGRGASVNYLDREEFKAQGIDIVFQNFIHPVYKQVNSKSFVSGLSILDMIFNLGLDRSRELFWEHSYIKTDV